MNIKIVKNKNSLTAFYLEYLGHKSKFYEDFFLGSYSALHSQP